MPSLLSISINGMHCQGCCDAIQAAITGLPGVKTATIFLGSADVLLDEALTPRQDVLSAIRQAGEFEITRFSLTTGAADAG